MLDDTIYLMVTSFTGYKETGQRDTKEGEGVWSGTAVRRKNSVETTFTSVTGTWDTNGGYCFDYTISPPTYRAGWDVGSSTPDGLRGGGTSYGYRQ